MEEGKRKLAHGPTVNALKRAKYEAKQERQRQVLLQKSIQNQSGTPLFPVSELNSTDTCKKWSAWLKDEFKREEYAVFLTVEDVRELRRLREHKGMKMNSCIDRRKSLVEKTSDEAPLSQEEMRKERLCRILPWLEPFFDLKKRHESHRSNGKNSIRHFIAEGTETVRLLIQKCEGNANSSYSTKVDRSDERRIVPFRLLSFLCKPATFFDYPVCLLDELKRQFFVTPSSSMKSSLKSVKTNTGHNVMPPFKIVLGTEHALSEIIGFPMARGAMACGIAPTFDDQRKWLKSLFQRSRVNEAESINRLLNTTTSKKKGACSMIECMEIVSENKCSIVRDLITSSATQIKCIRKLDIKLPTKFIALDAISNASNMGSILRTAAAFGIDAIILSDDCCDAWHRQSVRVSMGHVVSVPTIKVADLAENFCDLSTKNRIVCTGGLPRVLKWLREEKHVNCFAAVVDEDIEGLKKNLPPLLSLDSKSFTEEYFCKRFSESWCLILGNEGHGLREDVIQEANFRIRIRMEVGVDSLSLPVAAGILISRFCSRHIDNS